MNIAIIPARGGSKRIKKKNIKKFLGEPIISYVINMLKKTKIIDKIYVSTEADKVKKVASKYGAIAIKRPKKLSKNYVTTFQVINDAVSQIKNLKKITSYVLVIYPTSVFINSKHILAAYKLIKKNKNQMIFTAKKYPHPIERSFYFKKKNMISYFNKNKLKTKTQDLVDHYYDLGQFYLCKLDIFPVKNKIFSKGFPLILGKYEAFDIDNIDDWKLSEKIYLNK